MVMKKHKIYKMYLLCLMCFFLALPTLAHATTSTINTTLPAQGAPLSSAVMRSQFTAAYNDINALYALYTVPGSNTNIIFNNNGAFGAESLSTLKTNLSLNSVENTALSTWAGTTNVTTLGTIGTGIWQGTTLATGYGGTGLTTYAQGDILYASAVNTLAKLAKNTSSSRYLSNTGSSNAPAWAQVDMTTGVTGILPAGNGGSGNAFFQVSGPASSTKTYTLPNASATILTSNDAVTVAQGGTGLTAVPGSSGYVIINSSGTYSAVATTGSGSVVEAVSPALTGNPTATTQSTSDNSTRIATTAFVKNQIQCFPLPITTPDGLLLAGTSRNQMTLPYAFTVTYVYSDVKTAPVGNPVTNGTFASDSSWTKGAGWTISGGTANASTASSSLSQTPTVPLTASWPYSVTYTITRSAGTVTPVIGGTSGTARSSAGTYTETITSGVGTDVAFSGSGFTGTLDNVSVTSYLTLDVLKDGISILDANRLAMDNNVLDSRSNSVNAQPVISVSAAASGAIMSVDIVKGDDTQTAAGGRVTICGHP